MRRALFAAAALAAAPVQAQVETVTITGQRLNQELPAEKPVTVVPTEVIQRRQAENVFDILKDVPGVGVEGGPRTTGMKFTLRGFSDNEDVLFKIDGAVKGFEKYRFGSGVLLDPELINTLSVERGPSVLSGSGALGGTISASTKSAIDLLRRGEQWGVLSKLGWNSNNRERLRLLSAYGRPGDFDLLAAVVRRDSEDIRLADGSRLPVSATHSESRLAKIGWYPHERFTAELGHISYDSGPERQPYDVTGGLPGVGSIVRRTLDDATTTLKFSWDAHALFKLRGLVSRERTHLEDEHRARDENGSREGSICVTPTVNPSASYYVATCWDSWHYDISNSELMATSQWTMGPVQTELTWGWQGQDNRRDTARTTSNASVNQNNYPGGFNPDQPAGDKVSSALVAEARLRWQDFLLLPGVRRDRYTVSSQGQARNDMEAAGQVPDIGFEKLQPSLGLTWQPDGGAWHYTARYNEGFRPPLIDEYFANGSASSSRPGGRCRRTEGDPTAGGVVSASARQPLYDPAGVGLPYDPARDLAPSTGICGELYRPQESVNRELTVAWRPQATATAQWSARFTVYRIVTRHLLNSLQWVDGEAAQPGVERRRGVELEAEYRGVRSFVSLAHGRVRRTAQGGADQEALESFQVPADSTVLTLGLNLPAWDANAGWRIRHLADRRAYASTETPAQCIATPAAADGSTVQYSQTVHEIFGFWRIDRSFSLRASVDNLLNREYCGVSSFSGAVGFRAPGRAGKIALTAQF